MGSCLEGAILHPAGPATTRAPFRRDRPVGLFGDRDADRVGVPGRGLRVRAAGSSLPDSGGST